MFIKYSESEIKKIDTTEEENEKMQELIDNTIEEEDKDLKKEASVPFWINK